MPNNAQTVSAVFAYSGLDGVDWYNNTASAINPGQVVNMAGSGGVYAYGVARQLIPAYTNGTLATDGIFDLLLDGASSFNVGDVVYWNINTGKATSNGSYSSDIIGICASAALSTDISVRTRLTSWSIR